MGVAVSNIFFGSSGFFPWAGLGASTDFLCWPGIDVLGVTTAVALRACPSLCWVTVVLPTGLRDISDFVRAAVRPGWSFCPWGCFGGGVGFTGAVGTAVVFGGGATVGDRFVRALCGGSLVFGLVSVTWVVSLLPTSEVLEPPKF